MKASAHAGFRELSHGADAALEVWAPDLEGIFRQSAVGMLELMGIEKEEDGGVERVLELSAPDDESLLVSLLSRMLFSIEQERLAFLVTDLQLAPGRLKVTLAGAPVRTMQREIKAVTFNELAIRREESRFRVVIVFDL